MYRYSFVEGTCSGMQLKEIIMCFAKHLENVIVSDDIRGLAILCHLVTGDVTKIMEKSANEQSFSNQDYSSSNLVDCRERGGAFKLSAQIP